VCEVFEVFEFWFPKPSMQRKIKNAINKFEILGLCAFFVKQFYFFLNYFGNIFGLALFFVGVCELPPPGKHRKNAIKRNMPKQINNKKEAPTYIFISFLLAFRQT
jgi:hypothetical protein